MLTFWLPDEREEVPRQSGGIYQFSIRFPSLYELGLTSSSPNVDRVATAMTAYLCRVAPAFGIRDLNGFLNSAAQGTHLKTTFKVHATRHDLAQLHATIRNVFSSPAQTVDDIRAIASAVQFAFQMSPPLYIGIASDQSLGVRLDQHLSGSTHLATRLQSIDLEWRHLEFRCVPLPQCDRMAIRRLEKLLQATFKPTLSFR